MATIRVTLRAVIARINRALAHGREVLRTTRGERSRHELGDHYILDWNYNLITHTHVDPETLARDLGVLKPYEVVTDDGGGQAAVS